MPGIPIPNFTSASGPALSRAQSDAKGKIVFQGMRFDAFALPYLLAAGALLWWLSKR